MFSDFSHHAEAQVPIFTAQMKHVSKKPQKSITSFDFSNHAKAQVPILTAQNTIFEHGVGSSGSGGSGGNGARTAARNLRLPRRGSG